MVLGFLFLHSDLRAGVLMYYLVLCLRVVCWSDLSYTHAFCVDDMRIPVHLVHDDEYFDL